MIWLISLKKKMRQTNYSMTQPGRKRVVTLSLAHKIPPLSTLNNHLSHPIIIIERGIIIQGLKIQKTNTMATISLARAPNDSSSSQEVGMPITTLYGSLVSPVWGVLGNLYYTMWLYSRMDFFSTALHYPYFIQKTHFTLFSGRDRIIDPDGCNTGDGSFRTMLHFGHISCSKEEWKVTPCNRLAISEWFCKIFSFQDGGYRSCEVASATRRLYDIYRFTSSFLSCPSFSLSKKVFCLRFCWKTILFQMFTFWSNFKPENIYQSNATCNQASSIKRNQSSDLPRRHFNNSQLQEACSRTYKVPFKPFTTSGLDYQRRKIFSHTFSSSRLLRISDQLKTDDNKTSQAQNQGPSSRMQENKGKKINSSSKTSIINWKNLSNDNSNIPSKVTLKGTSERQKCWSETTRMERYSQFIKRKPASIGLVDRKTSTLEWKKFDSRKSNNSLIHRCLNLRLGWNHIIHGRWSMTERHLHINILELKAVLFAIKAFKDLKNQLILIKTDNTTTLAYINHQGGTTSIDLSMIAEELWNLCLERNINIKAEHIPGSLNLLADKASRMKLDRHDWKLKPWLFNLFNKIWGPHQVDLFASRHNTQIPMFFSWMPDPEALATDAFLQQWSRLNSWTNPPWILIPKILAKSIREKATMTILVPFWKSAPWFPLIMDLLIAPPILLLSTDIVVQKQITHENPFRNPDWRILVCRISGLGTKTKAFQRSLLTSSCQHWIKTLQRQFPQILMYGSVGVMRNHLIPLLAI
jgi:hypothetical protein